MKQYSKNDPEYRGNGHYVINGEEYMSIWTFKNKRNLGNNTNSSNGDEGKRLSASGVHCENSKPDFGNFDNILLYKVSDLETFYQF